MENQRAEGHAMASERLRTARKLAASGAFKAAHSEVDEAIRLGVQFCMTDRWEYFVSKAQLFDEESKPGAALSFYRRALTVALEAYDKEARTLRAVRFYLADALARSGEFEEALTLAPPTSSNGPAGFHALRATCLHGIGEVELARSEAKCAVETSRTAAIRTQIQDDLAALLVKN